MGGLRRHKRGHFFYRLNGRDVYLGFEPAEAYRKWREAVKGGSLRGRPQQPRVRRPRPERVETAPPPPPPSPTIQEAATSLLATVSPQRRKGYEVELKPVIERLGSKPLSELRPSDLTALRSYLTSEYKPWTANGRLSLMRRVLRHALATEMVSRVPDLSLLSGVPTGETSKAMPLDLFLGRLARVEASNPNLAKMLRLQFLCLLRPFSVPELVFGRGRFENEGVFVLDKSKTEKQVGRKQRLLLCPTAVELLDEIEPEYGTGPLYRVACNRAGFGAPHGVRHTAAQCLSNAGVEGALIEVCLGHALPGAAKHYYDRYEAAKRETERVLVPLLSKR